MCEVSRNFQIPAMLKKNAKWQKISILGLVKHLPKIFFLSPFALRF
jgi:hypothetical protein